MWYNSLCPHLMASILPCSSKHPTLPPATWLAKLLLAWCAVTQQNLRANLHMRNDASAPLMHIHDCRERNDDDHSDPLT